MPRLGSETADREADRESAAELRMAEEHLAGAVDGVHHGRVVGVQRLLVTRKTRRHVPETDGRERNRREALPAGGTVDPAGACLGEPAVAAGPPPAPIHAAPARQS